MWRQETDGPSVQRHGFHALMSFPALPGSRLIRRTEGLPASLGRMGSLEVRLATTKKDIRKAQKLRFKVFFKDGGAKPDPRSLLSRRDIDHYDRVCDHLLVVDHAATNRFGRVKPKVVGVYRLLRQEQAAVVDGFYSAREFDLQPLLDRHPGKRFLELGRSCVHPDWRSKRVVELLWRGIWTYARHHRVDVLLGCASLPGVNIGDHAPALDFISKTARADGVWAASARVERRAPDCLSRPLVGGRDALRLLPPLVKGYLRVGAKFGDGAVVDLRFGVVDVLVIMPVAEIDPRYISYFGGESSTIRSAA